MHPAFFLVAYLSDVVGTVAGFGSSTVFLPFALLFVDFRTALILVGFSHLFGNLGRLTFFRNGLDRRLLRDFGILSVIGSLIGAAFVPSVPQAALKGLLGAFLVVFAAASFRRELRLPARTATAMAGGATSGFLAGLIGTGGALRGAFLTAYGLPKEVYIATAAAIAIATDVTRLPVYLTDGGMPPGGLAALPVLFATSIAGSWTGRKLVGRIPPAAFRKVVLVALALAGLKLLADAATKGV